LILKEQQKLQGDNEELDSNDAAGKDEEPEEQQHDQRSEAPAM